MIRIYHARILTMQEDQEIFDGEIWISDQKNTVCRTGE